MNIIERSRVKSTANGKGELVPRDHVFLYLSFTVHYIYTNVNGFRRVSSIRIVLDCFYLLIFYFIKNFSP